jgi:LysR family transcriptional regulator (chromosome initiation inhibitor)
MYFAGKYRAKAIKSKINVFHFLLILLILIMFDYKLIQALHMVVISGGFEKAARELHLTQSAVSQRIKLLEEQTGQVLLARTTPPSPSRAGRLLLKHYGQVSRLEQDLAAELMPQGPRGFGSLTVGLNADSLATWFLDAVAPALKGKGMLVDLRVDDQEQTHRFMRDGEVLGCVSAREKPMQGCKVRYLGRMDYRMLASPEYAKRWFPMGYPWRAWDAPPA